MSGIIIVAKNLLERSVKIVVKYDAVVRIQNLLKPYTIQFNYDENLHQRGLHQEGGYNVAKKVEYRQPYICVILVLLIH